MTNKTFIEATSDTYLKSSPQARDVIERSQLGQTIPVTKGQTLEVNWAKPVGAHFQVSLVKPLGVAGSREAYHNWFLYKGHVKLIKQGGPSELVLDVPFFPQTDNLQQPHRTCNSSVHAMLVEYLKPGTLQPNGKAKEDDVYWQRLTKYGDTTDHTAHTRLLLDLGIKSKWRTDLGFGDLDQSLAQGVPVPIGILHRGPLSQPTGGHIILVVGRTQENGYVVHDPYGTLLDGYRSAVERGRNAVYPRELLARRWLAPTGWGRIVELPSG